MKRIISLLLALLAASFLFAQTIYTDGSVKIAGIGELPEGLFAKAKGYLPGDTITLTNSVTGEQIKLLNLGAPDAGEDVVILLSREAASKLGISSKEKMEIRLPGRNGNIEESVASQALIKKSTKTATAGKEEDFEDYEGDFDSYKASLEKPSPAEIQENGGVIESKPAESNPKPVVPTENADEEVASNEKVIGEKETVNVPVTEVEPEPEVEPVAVNKPVEEKIEESFVPDEIETYEEEVFENPNEPEADLTVPEKAYEIPSEKIDDGVISSPDEDLEGEAVTSSEKVSAESKAEPEKPVEERFDVEQPEPIEDPYSPEADLDGEGVSSNENLSGETNRKVEEPINVEPVVETTYVPESDMEGEGVASNESVTGEKEPEVKEEIEDAIVLEPVEEQVLPKEPYSPEDDLEGEGVSSNERVTGEKNRKPYKPEADLDGEGVSSNEKVTGEKEPEPVVEEPYVPEDDLPPEAVNSKESIENEKPYSPEADSEGEGVTSNEKVSGEKEPEKAVPVEEEPEYAPIILVPVEDKAPEHVENEEPKEKDVLQIVPEIVDITPAPVVTTYESETGPASDVIKEHTRSLEDLKKSDYFIQIATLSDPEGIKEIIEKYKKYDIILVRNVSGTYKVLVGPLTVDEYGVILKRFKSYGFKDAFLFKKK